MNADGWRARTEHLHALVDVTSDPELRFTLRRIVKVALIPRKDPPRTTAAKTAEQSGEPSKS